MYLKYNFKTRGIGIISSVDILKNTYIGNYFSKTELITNQSRAIYNGWIETNPLGRYINHNSNYNCRIIEDGNFIKLYYICDIKKFEEITINYLHISDIIQLPDYLIKKYSIINYNYINEPIIINSSLI